MSTGDLDENRSESSTDHAGSNAAPAETVAPATSVSTESNPSTVPAPATAPPAASGSTTAKTVSTAPDDDPVRDAIARLARDDGQPRDEKGRFAPTAAEIAAQAKTKPTTAKPAAAKQPDPKTTAPAAPVAKAPDTKQPATSPQGVDTDPYHGFDKREADALKGKTRQRIEDLHQRWVTTDTELKALKAKASEPDEFTKLVAEHQLDDDVGFVPPQHVAGLVKTQAAVTRSLMALDQRRQPLPADLQVVQGFLGRIDQLRGRLGFPAPAPAAEAAIKPFVGDLPADMKELIDVYGLPETDVRMLAAIKARGTTAAPASAAAQPPVQAAQPTPAQSRGVGPDMAAVYGQRLTADLTRGGVKPEMIAAHFQVLLPVAKSITQERFPGTPMEQIPAVFDALPPKERYDILSEANRRHQANARPPSRPPTPPPPATTPSLTGSSPRTKAASTNGDPVLDAISLLARPG